MSRTFWRPRLSWPSWPSFFLGVAVSALLVLIALALLSYESKRQAAIEMERARALVAKFKAQQQELDAEFKRASEALEKLGK